MLLLLGSTVTCNAAKQAVWKAAFYCHLAMRVYIEIVTFRTSKMLSTTLTNRYLAILTNCPFPCWEIKYDIDKS